MRLRGENAGLTRGETHNRAVLSPIRLRSDVTVDRLAVALPEARTSSTTAVTAGAGGGMAKAALVRACAGACERVQKFQYLQYFIWYEYQGAKPNV
eukprot:6207891-Pleurochrysis_carterae.AAC.2